MFLLADAGRPQQRLFCVSQGVGQPTPVSGANASNSLTAYFLQIAQNALAEEAPAAERRLSITITSFSLDKLDDRECLKLFRFTKSNISTIGR